MSDVEHKGPERKAPDKARDVKPGEGGRSLMNWQNLARARQAVSANEEARADFRADPGAFMQRFGIEVGAGGAGQMGWDSVQLQHLDADASAEVEMELAFCKVWGIVIVVAAAAAVVAAAANAGAGANVVVLANAAANVNASGAGAVGL